jgi:hypothetical protein
LDFFIALALGALTEAIGKYPPRSNKFLGYVGRLRLRNDPFNHGKYVVLAVVVDLRGIY